MVGGVIAAPVVIALAVPVAAVAASTYGGYLLTRRVKHALRRGTGGRGYQVADRTSTQALLGPFSESYHVIVSS